MADACLSSIAEGIRGGWVGGRVGGRYPFAGGIPSTHHNPRILCRNSRLVVPGKLDGPSGATQHTPRVTSVRYVALVSIPRKSNAAMTHDKQGEKKRKKRHLFCRRVYQ